MAAMEMSFSSLSAPPTMVSFQQKDEKILNLLEIW
jgi:hypothetical protein